jgi:transcriptional regulator with XRE-family HTH domain
VEGDLQRIVGVNLRRHREAQGISQEAYADLLGYHRTYLGAVERGERNLTLKSVERMAARVGVEVMVLLTPPTASKPIHRAVR